MPLNASDSSATNIRTPATITWIATANLRPVSRM
ncbi:Uncharacterised protein [Vibrio cholerae]|nr:Uncharacterised protein [Vibrio cholerae]